MKNKICEALLNDRGIVCAYAEAGDVTEEDREEAVKRALRQHAKLNYRDMDLRDHFAARAMQGLLSAEGRDKFGRVSDPNIRVADSSRV